MKCDCPICTYVWAKHAAALNQKTMDDCVNALVDSADERSMALAHLEDEVAAVLLNPRVPVDARRRLAAALQACAT